MLTRRVFLVGTSALVGACALPWQASRAAEAPIKLRELYNKDRSFSDLALANEGRRITVEGYMAPPLKADARFFVLTKMPMATCPFCEPGVEWPRTILPVYTRRTVDVVPFNVPITATGTLDLGEFTDPDTGFWSKVRLGNARYERT
ncbi:hypothetical protein F1188_06110 [Roseospira marina]|uniref:DUF3299 domain-containing protein n=1 Tax=Roseospira marina TaxID=140057 RepID=A0A5M6IFB2_9PROT|nr:hypothetical protein [Roseospira marina]KAA5606439.1 hypothetical protein F1188_06110 [Roseospira marina]MBB4314146.1 hypothetical protein [Roseospira marina]MBB5087307.1 hypothetical protein [Roseospira marina]